MFNFGLVEKDDGRTNYDYYIFDYYVIFNNFYGDIFKILPKDDKDDTDNEGN